MTEKEFKNCAWLYFPGTPMLNADYCPYRYSVVSEIYLEYGQEKQSFASAYSFYPVTQELFDAGVLVRGPFGNKATIDRGPMVMTDHVSYILIPTNNTTVSSNSGYKGQLAITLSHNGKNQKPYYINVYSTERACAKDYYDRNCEHLHWTVVNDGTVAEGYEKMKCDDCGYTVTAKKPVGEGPKDGQ